MQDSSQIDAMIEKVRNGDRDAYTEVVLATQDRLRAYIVWFCPNADAADDIAQDVYLYAYRNLDKYRSGTSLMAWMKTIARFRVMNQVRSASAQAHREQRYFDEFIYEAAAREESPPSEGGRLDALRQCLRSLPEGSQQLLQYRYGANMDAESIAAKVRKSAVAVRVTLLRVREQLRNCVMTRMTTEGGLS